MSKFYSTLLYSHTAKLIFHRRGRTMLCESRNQKSNKGITTKYMGKTVWKQLLVVVTLLCSCCCFYSITILREINILYCKVST